jgi:dipeptidyl aminopeptidase/acylaminoacyl peptidase
MKTMTCGATLRTTLFEEELRRLESQLPGKEVRFGARTSDESLWVVSAHSDTEPGEFYVWNLAAKTLVPQYRFYEELPRDALSERKPYHFKSSDGLDIPAFLTLPKGLPSKNLALIVNPHGGPWAQDLFGYNPFAEFLANRGYAVLQPNFRGSTGYGKAYLNAGDRQWGRKMQYDLTRGIKALVADGIVDPRRVGIIGASYGGYATLAGVAFTPELYAAAVDIVGPSNLITLYDVPRSRAAMRPLRQLQSPVHAAPSNTVSALFPRPKRINAVESRILKSLGIPAFLRF